MASKRYVHLGAIGLGLAVGLGLLSIEPAKSEKRLAAPAFQVDPFWPKPLPDNWVTGEVGGTCIDSQDHVFIVTRGFQTGGLVSPEGLTCTTTTSRQARRSASEQRPLIARSRRLGLPTPAIRRVLSGCI